MIDPTSWNLKINHTNEITCTSKRKSNFDISASGSSQNGKGRMALKAFLLHGSIDSSQLKQELEETAITPTRRQSTNTSRPKARNVNFNLSKNSIDYIPTTNATKSNWYTKSDYITFQEETRDYVRLVTQNDPFFYNLQNSNSSTLLEKGGPRNVACSSRNLTARTLLKHGWGDSDLILRGLESYLFPDITTYRKFYRKKLVQHYNNMICKNGNRHGSNDLELRSLSVKMTEASSDFAHVLGCIDAVCREKIIIRF